MNEIRIQQASRTENPTANTSVPLALPNVHVQEALARFAGDEMRYRHWLSDFMTHGPAALQQIRESIANGSREGSIRLVHALKGRTGMLGMSELHSICLSLEQALKEKEPSAFWVDELDQAIHAMRRQIDDALSGPHA